MSDLAFYTRHGLNLIPIVPGEKRPAIGSWAPYQQRMSTPDEHAAWWPDGRINPAVVCGSVSGNLAVIDCDNDDVADVFMRASPVLWSGLTCRTGKGFHYYLRTDKPVRTAPFELCGVTNHIKGEGGYVIAPPSLHPSGAVYEWSSKGGIAQVTAEWLADLLKRVGAVQSTPEERGPLPDDWCYDALTQPCPVGQRHDTMVRIAGQLAAYGVPSTTTLAIIENWVELRCDLSDGRFENLERQVSGVYDTHARRHGG